MARYNRRKINPAKSPYSKANPQPNRLYGERSYNDKFRVQNEPSFTKENKVDYDVNFKQYKPQKNENIVQLEWNVDDNLTDVENIIEVDLEKIQSDILYGIKQKENMLEVNEDNPYKIEASSCKETAGDG